VLYQLEEDNILDDLAIFNPIPQTRTSRKAATRVGNNGKARGKRRASPTTLAQRRSRAKRVLSALVEEEGIEAELEEMKLLHQLKKSHS
jgi:hypothetical protein